MSKLLNLSKYTPKELHAKGSNAREKDDHLSALQFLDHAIVGYQKIGNYRGMVNVLKDRTLTWKHYFLLTGDTSYAILAQKDAESMLEIVKDRGLKDKLSTSYFRLGEVAMLFENYPQAINNYKLSLEHYTGPLSEKGDFRYHLGEALYRRGQKKNGKKTMLAGLKEIQDGAVKVDDFLINVWESGCYGRLAELLKDDDPKEAVRYLEKAEKIAKSDKRLIIRRRQIKELRKKFA